MTNDYRKPRIETLSAEVIVHLLGPAQGYIGILTDSATSTGSSSGTMNFGLGTSPRLP